MFPENAVHVVQMLPATDSATPGTWKMIFFSATTCAQPENEQDENLILPVRPTGLLNLGVAVAGGDMQKREWKPFFICTIAPWVICVRYCVNQSIVSVEGYSDWFCQVCHGTDRIWHVNPT